MFDRMLGRGRNGTADTPVPSGTVGEREAVTAALSRFAAASATNAAAGDAEALRTQVDELNAVVEALAADGATNPMTVRRLETIRGSLSQLANSLATVVPAVAPETAPTQTTTGAASPLRGVSILVVDDSRDSRELLCVLLRKAGADVLSADDGAAAIDGLIGGASRRRGTDRPPSFGLILMDMQMPGLDGYSAASRMRAAGVTMPIIAVTADSRPEDAQRCLAAGCTSHLAKPVDRRHLIEECRRVLGERNATLAA